MAGFDHQPKTFIKSQLFPVHQKIVAVIIEPWLLIRQCDLELRAQCLESDNTKNESQLCHSLRNMAPPLMHLLMSTPQAEG